jgi:hypothetical protein
MQNGSVIVNDLPDVVNRLYIIFKKDRTLLKQMFHNISHDKIKDTIDCIYAEDFNISNDNMYFKAVIDSVCAMLFFEWMKD